MELVGLESSIVYRSIDIPYAVMLSYIRLTYLRIYDFMNFVYIQ